jgi:hypothetical protein
MISQLLNEWQILAWRGARHLRLVAGVKELRGDRASRLGVLV